MTDNMIFRLIGRDDLSRTLNGAADSADRFDRRVNAAMRSSDRSVARFTQDADGRFRDLRGRFADTDAAMTQFTRDANGRMHDLRGRFITTTDAMRALTAQTPQLGDGLTRISGASTTANTSVGHFTRDSNGRLRDLRGRFVSAGDAARGLAGELPGLGRRLGSVGGSAEDAASALGRGGGMSGAMGIAAGVLALELLPALGAAVPMLAGAGVAAGTLALGFHGVGDAIKASGDKKKYAEELKKLAPPARAFTTALVGLKGQFSGLGKQIQAVMLPGFTQAVKSAGPVVKILSGSMKDMGKVFGDAAAGAGRLMKEGGFQKDFAANLKLGTGFVKGMTSSLGPLVRSLLSFGAASGPTLKAFTSGLSGLLGKGGGGLAGMFEGLKTGIGGTATLLNGFFGAVNRILPALGRFSGETARALGPLSGALFDFAGKAVSTSLDGLGVAMKWLSPLFHDFAFGVKSVTNVLSIIGPTIKGTAAAIFGSFMPAFSSVDKARGPMQRLNDTILRNKGAIQEFSRQFGNVMITISGAVISQLPNVIKAFRLMSTATLTAFDVIVSGAAKAFGWIPGLGGKLKSANREFDHFKNTFIGGLHDAEQGARNFAAQVAPRLAANKLRMNIDNWNSQIATAKAKLKTVPASKQAALKATIADLEAKVRRARAEIDSVKGKTVGIGVYTTKYFKTVQQGPSIVGITKRAQGGPVGFPGGGPVRGPGTGTSDGVPLMASNGEYVINARSTSKYRSLIEAINADRLSVGGGMAGAGSAAARGLVSGMAAGTSGVTAGARSMAAAVSAGVRAELQIASPSKKMRALAQDIGRGLIVGLIGSRDKIKATAADLAKDIRTAFSGRKESGLLKMVDKQTRRLQDLASQRDKLTARIAAARQFASDVTAHTRESVGLANLGMEPEQVSAGSIKAGLSGKLAQLRQFTRYIDILGKKGLNKSLLRQILNMGPDAGYAYASALVGADKATFKSINSLQSQLDSSSDKLGKLGADRLYDAGKNAGKGFLKGLEGQQKDIEKLMLKIAQGMQKAIKKALGIRSPSTVMAKLGTFSTQGLARGLVAGLPALDSALGTVAGRVADTRPAIGRPAVVGRRGGVVVNITVQAGPASDPHAVAREVRTMLLNLKRDMGGQVLGLA